MDRSQRLTGARVAIYARFSSQRQRETSIDDQVHRCREHIAGAGGDPDAAIVFSDYAISGASLDRPGFEALMNAVDTRRIDAIVTEDISRISRDFADSAAVFKRLQFAEIPLISIADGIDTRNRDAKLAFTLKSLVADLYLDDLRDKTLRGLESRARAGYATGQVPYGYRTVPDIDPTGRVLGKRIEIDEPKAAIVRRIFTMYRDGGSLAGIARTLSNEGIPSPRAGTRHKFQGWGASTVRAMLYNERYIGVWRYKERQWVKVPGANKRRSRKRASAAVLTSERPQLRVVAPDLWQAVETRLQGTHRKYTRRTDGAPKRPIARSRRSSYLLSGLLYCGECGAPLTILSGSSASYYRCSQNRKRGTCSNGSSFREDMIRSQFVATLRSALMTPEILTYVRRRTSERIASLNSTHHSGPAQYRCAPSQIEAQLYKLIDSVAVGDSIRCAASTLHNAREHIRTLVGSVHARLHGRKILLQIE